MSNILSPKMQQHLSKLVTVDITCTTTSRWSAVDPRSNIPAYLVQEYMEYKKLLSLYRDRFEKWPDPTIREILFKQAIKIASEL